MKKTLVLLFALVGTICAQVANHEPGETLAHFRDVEKNTPSDWPGGKGAQEPCLEPLEIHKDPGTCKIVAWIGKSYKFRHDVLVRIEVNMRSSVSYAAAVRMVEARYGKPVDRHRVFELLDNEVVTEQAYWHAKAFGVWALETSYVRDGDSGRYVCVIVEADSEHPHEKTNPKF